MNHSIAASPGASQAAGGSAAVSTRAWVALAILWFVYVLNFLDRFLLSILAKPVQDALQISDGQLGLLTGLYFAMFYCFIAIPVGWLADKTNRVKVLSAACAIWSAATMACGAANSYAQLVVARMLVGVGEAGGVPPSYAIITDYFPPGRRGTALGIFNLGPGIGAALGIAFGAWITVAISWRAAFLILGGVGIVAAAIVVMVVREPKRGGLDPRPVGDVEPPARFWETVSMFFSRPTLALAAFGSGSTQFVTYGLGNFTVLFLMREKGMALEQVAIWYALVVGVAMSAGILTSGMLIDKFVQRTKQTYALVPAASLALAIPFYIGFVYSPSWEWALLLLAGPMFLNFFYLSSAVALVQEEVRPNQRVVSGALLLLVMNFIGLGLGPTYVGFASDYFRADHPDNSLQMALYTLVPFYIFAIILFLMLSRVLKRQASEKAEAAQ